MHHRLEHLYDCKCGSCNHQNEDLQLALNPKFKRLLKTVEKAFKKLHKNGKYKPEDLETVPEYRQIIRETNSFLSSALKDNNLSESMLKRLKEDIFLFSGLKTHAQLFEASRQLLTDDDKLKSFSAFSKDVASIKKNYNENYLEAEYDFAVGSVLGADRWESFSDSDRYYLQYRTAQDDRVRDSHAELARTTLPKDHPFWDRYFPPNGWRCRCVAVEVLARNNSSSNGAKAIQAGNKATTQLNKKGKNKLEIFRFNPGKAKVVFPPKHPYRKVEGAKKAGPIVLTMFSNDKKAQRKAKDREVKEWAKKNIPEEGKKIEVSNFKTGKAIVLRKNVRSISDHFTNVELKDMSKDIFNWLPKAKYKSTANLEDSNLKKSIKNIENKKRRGVTGYNYYSFEWNKDKYRLNVEIIKGQEYPFSVNLIANAE